MQLDACAIAPDSWVRLPIRDVCSRVTSGGTPSRKKPEFYANGSIGWVKTKELADGFISRTEESITSDAVAASSAKLLPKDTILLAMYGATVGMLGILAKEMACNQACCALLVKPEFDRDFLFYQLLAHRKQLESLATGAAQQNLSGQQIKELVIPFPPLEQQKAIGSYLRILEDRITLLRETNTTLEAIAQALFKSWFVDFDPVHAKMQGRAPEGMDEATAALFPDSFEDSELGPVPKGWKVGTLDTLAQLNPESWSTKNHPELIHYVDLANTKAGQIEGMNEFSFDEAPSRARRVLKSGDVIVGTVRPGNRSFARISVDIPGLTGSTGFAVLRPSLDFDQALTYIAATCDEAIDRLSHLADGGAYPAVRPEVVGSTLLVIAPELIRKAFGEITNTLYESIGGNQELMKHLATLRDTLLPRLISGELRISDTAKHAEGART